MPLNRQLGDTCQYFSLLQLMEAGGRLALSQDDMKMAVGLMATRGKKLGSGFIAAYCSLVKDPAKLSDVTGAGSYYADNKVHAIVIRRRAAVAAAAGALPVAEALIVWNPNVAEDVEFAPAANITSATQQYPSDKGALSLWSLKTPVLDAAQTAATNAERARQVNVFNPLSTYLRPLPQRIYNFLNLAATDATYAQELLEFNAAVAPMNLAERRQLCMGCAPAEYKLTSVLLNRLKGLLNIA
jgi:hypothetical protein